MTMSVKHILVPIDFGPTSEVALYYAKRLATRLGARLHLLHVIEDPIASAAWSSELSVVDFPRRIATMREDAEFRLGIFLTPAEREKFRAAVEVVAGSAAREIVAYAKTNAIDLIVIGTHGRCGFGRVMLGSVAERTIRTAPCPVLTVRTVMAPIEATEATVNVAVSTPSRV